MPGTIDARLAELNIVLPPIGPAAGNYVPHVIAGDLVFLSGQVPMVDGVPRFVGKLGREISVEQGYEAAALCAVSLLTRLRAACDGDLDRVARCVKLVGFVNCVDSFGEQPKVVNGASDLMVKVFGEAGRHARSAIGHNALPFGVAVEVEAVFQIRR